MKPKQSWSFEWITKLNINIGMTQLKWIPRGRRHMLMTINSLITLSRKSRQASWRAGVCLFQLFQLFSDFGPYLDHSWDQCKSDEKTYTPYPHPTLYDNFMDDKGASKSFLRDFLFKIFPAASPLCGFLTGLPPLDFHWRLISALYPLIVKQFVRSNFKWFRPSTGQTPVKSQVHCGLT